MAASFIVLGAFVKIGRAAPVSLSQLTRPTIIIDAGHGGEDGGAVGVDGIVEKNINLSIAQKLRDILVMNGYQVVMTRDSDISIYDSDAQTLREKKVSDLNNRLDIIKAHPVDLYQHPPEQFGSPIYSGTPGIFQPEFSDFPGTGTNYPELRQTVSG